MGWINRILGNASEVSIEKLQEKYGQLLIDQEEIRLGFMLVRDTYIFTTRRLILVDKQDRRAVKSNTLVATLQKHLPLLFETSEPLIWMPS